MGALHEEKIRFQVIGMSAANLQGVPGSTVDVDLWLELPARDYAIIREHDAVRKRGGR